jgi:membrane protein implicated in regulation of membrane protease activity
VEDVIGIVLLGAAAVTAIFFAAWILIAAIVRIFAWVLVVWAVTFVVGVVVGILTGVVIPPRVLRGKAATKPKTVTPNDVVAGKVLGKAPRGPAKHLGWDWAWPVYNPHQAKRDANAVIKQAKRVVPGPFKWLFALDASSAGAAFLSPWVPVVRQPDSSAQEGNASLRDVLPGDRHPQLSLFEPHVHDGSSRRQARTARHCPPTVRMWRQHSSHGGLRGEAPGHGLPILPTRRAEG